VSGDENARREPTGSPAADLPAESDRPDDPAQRDGPVQPDDPGRIGEPSQVDDPDRADGPDGGGTPPEPGRGREAAFPFRIPLRGWRDVVLRVKSSLIADNVPLVAAGVAFYGLLAFFPAIAVLVSLYGLVAEPGDIAIQINDLPALPEAVKEIGVSQLQRVSASAEFALRAGIVALLIAVWSSSRAANALMISMNIAYGERDGRNFFYRNTLAVVFTIGFLLAGIVGLSVITVAPTAVRLLGLAGAQQSVATGVPWILLYCGFLLMCSLLYRYGPDRRNARWTWISPGAVLAATFWIVSSVGFSYYVTRFGSYNETYGSVGAIVILLLWFWISALVIILGAKINAEIEHQTRHDTTVGPERPMGDRGAYMADNEGPVP
jgi:membrane protein